MSSQALYSENYSLTIETGTVPFIYGYKYLISWSLYTSLFIALMRPDPNFLYHVNIFLQVLNVTGAFPALVPFPDFVHGILHEINQYPSICFHGVGTSMNQC